MIEEMDIYFNNRTCGNASVGNTGTPGVDWPGRVAFRAMQNMLLKSVARRRIKRVLFEKSFQLIPI